MRVMHSADRTMFTFFTNSAIRKKTCEVDSKSSSEQMKAKLAGYTRG